MARMNEFSCALAKAAGLDPNKVLGVSFELEFGKPECVIFKVDLDEGIVATLVPYYLVKEGYGIPLRSDDGG